MELKSEPAYIDEVMRDIDVAFVGCDELHLTLRPEDTLSLSGDLLVVQFINPAGTVEISRKHVAWLSRRERIMRKPIELGSALYRQSPEPPPAPAPPDPERP